jgi:four helix bundle protein
MPANHPTDLRDRVFEFVCAIVLFCRELSKEPGVDRQIAWQLAAAATSVGSNLEEAKAAYSRRDFAAKNAISLKEIREALYWLRVIQRCQLAPAGKVDPLLAEASELTAMLTAGMKRLHPVGLRVLAPLAAVLLLLPVLKFLVLSSKF